MRSLAEAGVLLSRPQDWASPIQSQELWAAPPGPLMGSRATHLHGALCVLSSTQESFQRQLEPLTDLAVAQAPLETWVCNCPLAPWAVLHPGSGVLPGTWTTAQIGSDAVLARAFPLLR